MLNNDAELDITDTDRPVIITNEERPGGGKILLISRLYGNILAG